MINLQHHFINFSKNALAKNPSISKDDERVLEKLFFMWKTTESDSLNGLSPERYVLSLSPFQLIESLKMGENQLILERVKATKECAVLLLEEIEEEALNHRVNEDFLFLAVNLLADFEIDEPISTFVILLNKNISSELKEEIIERLKVNCDKAKQLLLEDIDSKSFEFKTIAAEILLYGEKSEEVFKLLVDLFMSGNNIPLYANYLGKYGDERAASYLYPVLDKADYVDFTEIKNAIERLGGLVDDDYRDFSSDPLYQIIKNQKK